MVVVKCASVGQLSPIARAAYTSSGGPCSSQIARARARHADGRTGGVASSTATIARSRGGCSAETCETIARLPLLARQGAETGAPRHYGATGDDRADSRASARLTYSPYGHDRGRVTQPLQA